MGKLAGITAAEVKGRGLLLLRNQLDKVGLTHGQKEKSMCEKCVEIDRRIDHYRWLAKQLNDNCTIQGIYELIEQHEAEKRSLHPTAPLD